ALPILDAVPVLEMGLARRLEHVHAVIAARVDRRLDVIRDVRHEQHREDQPRDEHATDNREVQHGQAGSAGWAGWAGPAGWAGWAGPAGWPSCADGSA